MNKIHYFKEKKWIMAWWFKKNGNITEGQMMYQWKQWWNDDFDKMTDQRFQDAFAWVKETLTKTKDEIQKGRYAIADCRPVPRYLQALAASKGFHIRKSNVTRKPLNVSGYAIYKNNSNKNAVYGKRFDLTVKQVREFLEQQK